MTMAWTRQPGRNPRKIYLDKNKTVLAVHRGITTIDMEVAVDASNMKDLKDKVFEDLYKLSWWHPTWVDYPGFCSTGGDNRTNLWNLIRREWSKRNKGMALDYDKSGKGVSRRPGKAGQVWFVITDAAQARETMMISLDDNWNRSDHDIEAFVDLFGNLAEASIREAMVSGPHYHNEHRILINSTVRISEKIQKSTIPSLRSVLGWQDEDDAVDFLETHAHQRNKTTRVVGRKLWGEYVDKVVTP